MGRSPPPFFPGAGRTPAREMRRFARPGRGRHDLGGLCGHGAGTSRGRESSGEDLTARSTALTRPAWSANSADAKTASAQFCWRCGELIRQGRLPLTEADGKTERTDEAKTKAKGWKRKSPSKWSVALAAPASLAAAADSGGQACAALHCRMMRARNRYYGTSGYKAGLGMFIQFIQSCRGRAESEGSQRWVRSHFAAGQAKP
ncbi:unnamed protein product [Effrenium voratum]|nr:unnamed protein product [Effrenium voratum]